MALPLPGSSALQPPPARSSAAQTSEVSPGSAPPSAHPGPGSPTDAERRAAFEFSVGKMLVEEHAYGAAEAAFQKAIELVPDDPYLRIEYIQVLDETERPVRELSARQGDYGKAVEQAKKALELAPDNVDVLRAAGQVYLRMADVDADAARAAFDAFTKVREKEPWDVQTMVALGQLHLSRGEFAEAADVFAEASRYVPNNRILYNFLADARERAGQDEKAADALQRILALDPGDVGTRIRLAEMLGRVGEHAKALETLDGAPASVEDDERVLYLRARELFATDQPEKALELTDKLKTSGLNHRLRLYVTDLRARILASLDRSDEALHELAALLDLDPANADLLRRVTAQLAQGGQREEAKGMLESFLDRHGAEAVSNPGVAKALQSARLALAAFMVDEKSWDGAVAILEPMVSSSDPETRATGVVNTAEVLQQAGRSEQALDLVRDVDPQDPGITRKRVELLLRNGEDGRARKELRSVRHDGDLDVGLATVRAFQAAERYEETVPVLEELARRNPKSLDASFLLGAAQERTGSLDAAAQAFLHVLEIDPDHAQTLNYLGYMWADRGENLDRALGMIQRAVHLDPQNGAYLDSLGWAHYRLGHYHEAQQYLEQAVRLTPGDPVVYEHLGDVFAAQGDNRKAAESYRRALQVAAEDGNTDQDLKAVQHKLDGLTMD